ncbi:MAG: rod shape-determining protein MreC [Acidaminococcaceae bacterium]|jgi:rod shape-determining protein MreC|nr:rod shape-determining protein MreC [Acidaminococcaceae bacterium]
MKKQELLIVLAVLMCVAMTALAIQQRARFPLVNRMVAAVVGPVNGTMLKLHDSLVNMEENNRSKASLQAENLALKRQLDQLTGAAFRIENLEAENALLNKLVGYKDAHQEQKLLPARVIALNMGELRDACLVDKGHEDGVQQGMLIIAGSGLAGVVDEVYPSSSRMMIISSSRTRIGARVLRAESRAVGVVTGRSLTGATLKLQYLPREADIKEGDSIVTSGVGGKYPPGIYIGTVGKVEVDAGGLQKLAQVTPAANLTSLEKVFILVGLGPKATDMTGQGTAVPGKDATTGKAASAPDQATAGTVQP